MQARHVLLAASLLIAVVVAPTATAETNLGEDSESSRCDGVIIDGKWTGHCGNGCYGDIYINDAWFASYTC